jgi:hypothetical protein
MSAEGVSLAGLDRNRTGRILGKTMLFSVVVLATMLGLAWALIDFLGRKQWDRVKKDLLAEGEPLSLSELIPPAIPDEQNFFAAPPWNEFVALREERRLENLSGAEFSRRNPLRFLEIGRRDDGSIERLTTLAKRGANFARIADRLTDLEGFALNYRKHGLAVDGEGPPSRTVLEGLERAIPLLSNLEAAGRRPLSRPPLWIDLKRPFETPLPHMEPPIALAQTLQLRAVARMADGDSRGASLDILLIMRLADALESDPFVISKLVRFSCLSIAFSAVWECSAIGGWKPDELENIQRALAVCKVIEDAIAGLRAERGLFNEWLAAPLSRAEMVRVFKLFETVGAGSFTHPPGFDWFIRLCPAGIFWADLAFQNRAIQETIEALQTENASALSSRTPPPDNVWLHPFSSVALRGIAHLPARAFNTQSQLDLAVAACALERFRLEQGSFPDTLDPLVPRFLGEIPLDPVTRKPIFYERLSQENFLLACSAVASEGYWIPDSGNWIWRRLP